MGKLMLLLVTVSTIVGMLLHGSIADNINGGNERFVEHGSKMLARELAMTGLNDALITVSGYFSGGTYSGPSGAQGEGAILGNYDGGSYSIDLDGSGNTTTVTVTSSFEGEQYTVERTYEYVSTGGGVPDFMNDAISCGSNMTVMNDLNVHSSNPGENANIHANGIMSFNGGTSTVEGFGTYGGSVAFNTAQTATDILQPVSNPESAPVHDQVDPVDFPILNASSYEGIATEVTNGDVFLFGPKPMGTETDPKIWYINGNVTVVALTSFTGYGVVLVNGNVTVLNHIASSAIDESSLGFYVDGTVNVAAPGLNLDGQWYVDGAFLPGINTTFQGNMSTSSVCSFTGPWSIGYLPANPALTEPFWSGSGGTATLQLSEAREW